MKILFLGGDKRQLSIINELKNKYSVETVGYDNILINNTYNKKITDLKMNNYQAIVFPVSGVLDNFTIEAVYTKEDIILPNDLLTNTNAKALIFTGIKSINLDKMLKLANREAIILMNDQNVVKENTIPTIEGIIGDLINHTDYTINQANILVLGYGKVGKSLTDLLTFLGAHVIVGKNKTKDDELLKSKGIKSIFTSDEKGMENALRTCDIIINTVPSLILNKTYLKFINKEAYLLDISSFPHGIDFNYADALKLNHKKLLGIPGLVAPKTAGLILAKKIKKVLGGERYD